MDKSQCIPMSKTVKQRKAKLGPKVNSSCLSFQSLNHRPSQPLFKTHPEARKFWNPLPMSHSALLHVSVTTQSEVTSMFNVLGSVSRLNTNKLRDTFIVVYVQSSKLSQEHSLMHVLCPQSALSGSSETGWALAWEEVDGLSKVNEDDQRLKHGHALELTRSSESES